MKKLFKYFLMVLVASSMFLTACEPVDDTDPTDDPRDEYVGVWRFTESSTLKSTKAQSYIVTISKDEDNSSQVVLENFGNPGATDIIAIGIVTSNQIIISSQTMSNAWVVEGSGKVTNVATTTMSWNYSITAGGDKEYYTATASKL
jgi:hypothetical protein